MSGALGFDIDLEDIKFVLFEQLRVQDELATIPKYADFDRMTYEATLDEAARVAKEILAPINGPGDREGCKLDTDGNVTTPQGYKEAWQAVSEGGWIAVSVPPEHGGSGMPLTMGMAVVEMFIGAAMAFEMYPGLTSGAARVIAGFGPDGRKENVAEKMFTGEWAGTMCLTEAGAGSDVGENRCKATPIEGEPGAYHLEGEKIFISGGDHDLTKQIVHLVLARTPDSPPGTKGLSLFLVPKFDFDGDLTLGARNGAYVTKIEEKMGIHGSSTCVLTLGDRAPCKGWLVGNEHEGIKIMFHMMNEARIGVGAQGVAIGATAYHYAKTYAKERLQGSTVANLKDPGAPRAAIIEHPDVKRMLMTMKVQVEAMRSMLYRLGHRNDVAENDTTDKAKAERYMGRVELLVPILKAWCTDVGFDCATQAVQVLGGYGFIGEYPVEQLVRDGKIMSIYEGTNGIQALDLLGRKLRQRGGALFMEWMEDAKKECALGKEEGFGADCDTLAKAVDICGAAAMHLGGLGMQGQMDAALLQAYPFLQMMGTVHLGLESLNQARAAKKFIEREGETSHRKGKLANFKFYVANILPMAVAHAKRVQSGDTTALDASLFD
ncbi:MAG: acyl-CoA dehydrogenase [Alphaproteobacteria bacterium]|nr:acyl-CoA dehydrogenase [Alphaproteobacteria bacterium]MCB9695623.1 acyl-CoA dehydrogenase [Alphaproteobacteria bacterium]